MQKWRCVLSQPAYYKKLWKQYSADLDLEEGSFLRSSPPRHPMHARQEPLATDSESIDASWYKGIIGALNYLAIMTRPDISYCMSVLASKCNSPDKGDFRRVKHLFRFVMGTRHLGLNFQCDSDMQLHIWADASYASHSDARSQTGYSFALGETNAAFYVKHLVTLSSTESEYVACFHSICEAVFLRRLLEQLGFPQEPLPLFQDNQSVLHWLEGRQNFHRCKHMHVKYEYCRQMRLERVIAPEYLITTEQIADIFTKPLLNNHYEYLASGVLGIYSFAERIENEQFQEVLLSE